VLDNPFENALRYTPASLRQQAESKEWQDERLKVMLLQAQALQEHGERQQALQLLGEALAEPAGFVRLFFDERLPMARLLAAVAAQGIMSDYIKKLLTVWQADAHRQNNDSSALPAPAQALIEPLSQRELADAIRYVEKGHAQGKVIITIA
jgi:LuxR family maltose regulon positive regulatory protein